MDVRIRHPAGDARVEIEGTEPASGLGRIIVDDGEEEGEGVEGGGEGESVGGCVRGKGAEVIQSRTTVDNTRCCGR